MIDGIHAVREVGLRVVLATTREIHNILALCANLGIAEVWAACSNGAVVARVTPGGFDIAKQVTFDPRPPLEALAAAAIDLRFAIEDVGVGFVMSGIYDDWQVRGPSRVLEGSIPSAATLVTVRTDVSPAAHLMTAIDGLDVCGMPYDEDGVGYVDLTPANVSKATGVQGLAGGWGISAVKCTAVGDFVSDIPLLRWAGWGVAMGQSSADVLEAADAIAPGIEDDGLVPVLSAILSSMAVSSGS